MKENTGKYRKGLSKKESFLLAELARQDKNIFTVKQAKKILNEEPYVTLHSLKEKKWILGIKAGLYAIVPLDIGVRGADSFIVHDFIIASHLVRPYYIGFWSALNYHGLSDQIPSSVFIATQKAKKPLTVLNTEFVFVQLNKERFFGVEKTEIDRGKINISNINKTIADCLDHPEHSGGIEEIARSIYFSHKELDFKKIKQYAFKMRNIAILKRLGYVLEKIKIDEGYKDTFKDVKLTKGYPKLDTIGRAKGKYNERWKLLINVEIDSSRWMY